MSLWKFSLGFAPIMGFIGQNGAGKSAMAVATVWDQAKRTGAPVASNIPLTLDGVDVLQVRGLSDLMKLEGVHVLWDDVSAVAPARQTMDVPPAIVMRMASLRHYDCTLVWTAPDMMDVDVKIRQVTQSVVGMKPIRTRYVEGQLWPNTSLSFATQYVTTSNEVTAINSETPRAGRGFVRLKSLPLDAYDTRAEIELLADHAVCTDCGLPRRREYCKGHHHTSGSNPIPEAKALEAEQSNRPGTEPGHSQARLARPAPLPLARFDGSAVGATLEGSG